LISACFGLPARFLYSCGSVSWSYSSSLPSRYRNASIVHDVECVRKTKPWEEVHLMFYEGCRCSGLPELQAKTLNAAVYHFGPRWEIVTEAPKKRAFIDRHGRPNFAKVPVRIARVMKAAPKPEVEMRQKLESYVKDKNASLYEIRKLKPSRL
jgi:hypothetical protein